MKLKCQRCQTEAEPDLVWQTAKNGVSHLRANCPKCGRYIQFVSQVSSEAQNAPPKPEGGVRPVCPRCGVEAVEVVIKRRRGDFGSAPAEPWDEGAVKTICIGCGWFFGYRPVATKKHSESPASEPTLLDRP